MTYRNLYIHVPFCLKKCDYCAFYSIENNSAAVGAWLEKVRNDLESSSASFAELRSIYFGGGTPTLLPSETLTSLFQTLRSCYPITEATEITMESNPESVTEEKAVLIAEFVNRISMGVQSFDQKNLDAIGRKTASVSEALTAYGIWRKAGLRNIGVDMIYGIPGQTLASWKDDLHRLSELAPEHVSAYALTLEEGTALAGNTELDIPDDEVVAEMWEVTGEILRGNGMHRYEVSNYAKTGCECKHNQHIWHGDTYLGVGPSAVSFDGNIRFMQISSLNDWLAGAPPEKDIVSKELRAREIFIMGLRTVRGWHSAEFTSAAGVSWEEFLPQIENLAAEGLLEYTAETVKPTQKGLLFWNYLAEVLI